ncbi:MAG: hypothetical protein HYS65_16960, partial [Betaproteobacteria bacterium]|nr:hypothetical protein [Betaproteobacteria bacterium]
MMSARFSATLTGLYVAMRYCAWRDPAYCAQLAERDPIAQIRTLDADIGRWYEFKAGKVRSQSGIHPRPDVTLSYETAAVAARLLTLPVNWQEQINAA